MDVLRLIGIGMVICFASLTLRSRNPEFALILSVAGGLLILGMLFNPLADIISYLNGLIDRLHVPADGMIILVKCLGLSYIAKIACDTCIDCGETSTATKIEFAAKIGMMVTALPLFDKLLNTVTQFTG